MKTKYLTFYIPRIIGVGIGYAPRYIVSHKQFGMACRYSVVYFNGCQYQAIYQGGSYVVCFETFIEFIKKQHEFSFEARDDLYERVLNPVYFESAR